MSCHWTIGACQTMFIFNPYGSYSYFNLKKPLMKCDISGLSNWTLPDWETLYLSLSQNVHSQTCTMAQHVLAREKEQNNEMLMKNVGNYTNNVQVMWKMISDFSCSEKKAQQVSNLWKFTIILIVTLFSLCLQICMDNIQKMLSVLDECFMTDSHPHCDCVVPRANHCISPKQMSSKQKLEGDHEDFGSSFKLRL